MELSELYLVFSLLLLLAKEQNIKEQKNDGRSEGVIVSDIGYIKACVDRVEKNLNKVDERYRIILERVAKAEEAIVSVNKRLDEL